MDKIHDTWWDYMYPLYLLRAITTSKYGRTIGPIGIENILNILSQGLMRILEIIITNMN